MNFKVNPLSVTILQKNSFFKVLCGDSLDFARKTSNAKSCQLSNILLLNLLKCFGNPMVSNSRNNTLTNFIKDLFIYFLLREFFRCLLIVGHLLY